MLQFSDLVDRELLAERVRYERLRRGMTLAEFGEFAGVSGATISHWERGTRNPEMKSLRKVARATGRPVSWFLGIDEEEVAS